MELFSILVLLDSRLQTCMTYTIGECTVNKLLMMDKRTVRNMYRFMTKLICEISASSCGRGVTLNPHPLLVPRSKIE